MAFFASFPMDIGTSFWDLYIPFLNTAHFLTLHYTEVIV